MANTTFATDAVLVSMPWAPPHEPSLGLGILSACLKREALSCRVLHAAPQLMRWMSPETYQFLADCWGINDFLFSGGLDRELDQGQQDRLRDRLEHYAAGVRHERYPTVEALWDLVFEVRDEVVPAFLDDCLERVLAESPRMVGFTCLFDQTIASLALAQRIRERRPDIPIAFGGYALQGPPGQTVTKAFGCVDALVLGDGEQSVVDLVRAVRRGEISAGQTETKIISSRVTDLEESPMPDYSDWFSDASGLWEHGVEVRTRVLPVEASRGCWWGQNMHCIFCGIDDEALKYRHKSADTTLGMLRGMRERYGDFVFRFSDYIMPKRYYTDLLPVLANEDPKFRLQGEIKANHPPERVRLLAAAGFHEVQPGVESFSTPVLRGMNKGVRGIDNVGLLKTAYGCRLVIDYNILYGLPGDTYEAYLHVLTNMPNLYHLTPPVSRNETVVTRFAPLHADPARFGITKPAVHHVSYDVIFSTAFLERTGFSLDDYAYYFDRNFEYPEELKVAYSQLVMQIDHWKSLHQSRFVELSYEDDGESLTIIDTRFSEFPTRTVLSPAASRLYMACDEKPSLIPNIRESLGWASESMDATFDAALMELDDARVIWQEGNLLQGLAIPREVVESHRENGWCNSWMALFT